MFVTKARYEELARCYHKALRALEFLAHGAAGPGNMPKKI